MNATSSFENEKKPFTFGNSNTMSGNSNTMPSFGTKPISGNSSSPFKMKSMTSSENTNPFTFGKSSMSESSMPSSEKKPFTFGTSSMSKNPMSENSMSGTKSATALGGRRRRSSRRRSRSSRSRRSRSRRSRRRSRKSCRRRR
jgi:hypothetical protein